MALTLISTHTVDAACGCIDITSGIDSTYDSYEFHCVNMHPAIDGNTFLSKSTLTTRVVASTRQSLITSTYFGAVHAEVALKHASMTERMTKHNKQRINA
jgi:hypothetical protein